MHKLTHKMTQGQPSNSDPENLQIIKIPWSNVTIQKLTTKQTCPNINTTKTLHHYLSFQWIAYVFGLKTNQFQNFITSLILVILDLLMTSITIAIYTTNIAHLKDWA